MARPPRPTYLSICPERRGRDRSGATQTTTREPGAFEGHAGGRPRREICLLSRSTESTATGLAHSSEGRQPAHDRIPRTEDGHFALVAHGARRSTLCFRTPHLGC